MTTTSPVRDQLDATRNAPGPARVRVAAISLGASAATIIGLLATTPWGERLDSGSDEVLNYDNLVAVHDAAWPGLVADGFAFAVIGLTVGLGVLHLVRDRGRIAALVGAVLTTVGGILFAMGATAFATLGWFASADGLADGTGQSLVDFANDNPVHLMGPNLAGFLLTTIGSVVLAVALIRSRAVPVYAVVAYLLLVLAQFSGMPGRAMDFLQIAMMLLLIAFAAVLWARADARA
ncbi:conserved membrane hypothetical protein [metagenome]|uniref:DUF4386 family protein n=1 Tax=metagenome TaxID=256318 RepID=A0A2P2CAY4_9ZZZZ